MQKVKTIKFAVVITRVSKNQGDISFYHLGCPEAAYIDVLYDGSDFIIHNKETNRKVYVAKTNVSQWELDDTEGKENTTGVPKAIRTKANA